MNTSILHYWLVNMRGGENVLRVICDIFPQADIFTHVYSEKIRLENFPEHRVKTTFINKLPFPSRFYQNYLPLMPAAARMLDMNGYDLIISSESGPIKGIRKTGSAVHVCYCHTPMRYLWDMYEDYYQWVSPAKKVFMRLLTPYLRKEDLKSAESVDHFIANSNFVAERIKRIYKRDATVIHPPVDADFFSNCNGDEKEDYFMFAGQLNYYKRADIAVKAFNRNGLRLKIVGDGEEYYSLKRMAKANIEFVGKANHMQLKDLYSKSQALIFPNIEDFGMIPVECMATGTPVIAYNAGGARETVINGKTGLFFDQQDSGSLCNAVEEFSSHKFDPRLLKTHSQKFSKEKFKEKFKDFLAAKLISKD